MDGYLRPRTLDDALAMLAATPGCQVLAGGTDVFPARTGAEVWLKRDNRPLLDLSGIAALAGITETATGWRIGALATWTEFCATQLPPAFDGLKQAARQVGGAQVQNRGTLLGNLCNASPAADGAPPLLTLDAQVELSGPAGGRVLPLAAFLLGNRRTALAPGEIATALLLPHPPEGAMGGFMKLGARSHLVISIAMVAGTLALEGGVVRHARLAVGACSATAQRLPLAEAALLNAPPDPARLLPEHLAALTPIDDVRASAAYRRHAALVLLQRLVESLA
jgi:N-methylhydantoinase B